MPKFNYSSGIPIPNWATHSLIFTGIEGMNGVYIGEGKYQYYGGCRVEYLDDEPVDVYGVPWPPERWVNAIKDSGPYTLTDLRIVEENE